MVSAKFLHTFAIYTGHESSGVVLQFEPDFWKRHSQTSFLRKLYNVFFNPFDNVHFSWLIFHLLQSLQNSQHKICDVSWISKYPNEKEFLISPITECAWQCQATTVKGKFNDPFSRPWFPFPRYDQLENILFLKSTVRNLN